MADQDDLAGRFFDLHGGERPLLLPNPWDAGSARLLASLGFEALATTSSGFAASLGRLDGCVTRDEALAHAASIVAATSLPVSADLEDGFADDPAGVAETVRMAIDAGLAGCSIEDFTGDQRDPIHDIVLATHRIAAAARAAHAGPGRLVLTARAENHIHGRDDLDDTIARLRAYGEAGADVLYAPGLRSIEDIRRVVAEAGRPVNVLAVPGAPAVAELAAAGVARISIGGAFAFAALDAVAGAANELLEHGTYDFLSRSRSGLRAARTAFALRQQDPAGPPDPAQVRVIQSEELTMSSARDGDAHMISLFGELDLATADGVRQELDRVAATDALAIVLDLGGLTSVDSSGVRLLLSAGARERAGSNRLTLRRGSPSVQRVFELCGVADVLPFAE